MSINVDHEEILSLPDGIFRVKYYRLSVKTIRNLRSRWTSDIFKLRREIASLNRKILAKKRIIEQKEAMVNKLTEEKLHNLMEIERAKKKEIEGKANQFLRDLIGEEAFNELQTKGFFRFIGLDGKTYRLKKNGLLQVDGGKYWYECCYVKPSQLPLPDIIASVFGAVKQSERFPKETSLKKTEEEVIE